MTQHSKSRQQAESAFAKSKSQFLARTRAVEPDMMARARKEKTLRLKNAPLAKQADECARATAAQISKRPIRTEAQRDETSTGTQI